MILVLLISSCANEVDTDQLSLSSGYMSVNTTNVTLEGKGGNHSVSIQANCAWSVVSSAEWLTVTPAQGNGNASITLSATTNPSVTSDRTATVTVRSEEGLQHSIQVRQEKNIETLRLNVETLSFAAIGEAKILVIESNAKWEILGAEEWFTLNRTSGEGNGEITITATENISEDDRSATLTIKGTTLSDRVVITQEGRATNLTVATTSLGFDAVGSTKTIVLDGTASWQATSSQEWVSLGKLKGVGTDELQVTCSDNATETVRTATITITTRKQSFTVSISQEAGKRPMVSIPQLVGEVGRYQFTVSSAFSSNFEVTDYGFCISVSQQEVGNSKKITSHDNNNSFLAELTDLDSHVTYYVRAYATNKVGIAYSEPLCVTTQGSEPQEDDNNKPNL